MNEVNYKFKEALKELILNIETHIPFSKLNILQMSEIITD